ncbi:MAG: hypothetical protein EA412_09980 [Chitinophagaceae bacterium]|nr:MAG: hypothetical protein EA412_09980 [Chitinophagaceae bacterium]
MISLFKNQGPLTIPVLFLYTLCLKLFLFFYNDGIAETPELSSHLFLTLVTPFSEYIFINTLFFNFFFSVVLVHQSILIRNINDQAEFWSKGTSLPSLFFVTFCVSITQFNILLTPLIIGNYFILYALKSYINLYNEVNFKEIFYLGLFAGIAAIYHFPLVFISVTSVLYLIVYINASIRLHLVLLTGIVCSLFLISSTYFLLDKLDLFAIENIIRFTKAPFSPEALTTEILFIFSFLIILSFIGVGNVSNYFNRMNVRTRAVWGSLFIMTVMSLFAIFLTTDGKVVHFYFLGIPFSFLTGRIFYLFKKNITGELIFLVLLFLIINFQFSLFF